MKKTAILALCLALGVPAFAAGLVKTEFSVLVFSKTTGFRHDSIPDGIAAIERLGAENNFAVYATEDESQFTDENLALFDAVIFLNTTGTVLNAEHKAAFERFIRNGGGFVGIHSASDTEYNWPWYGRLVGAYFRSHPAIQQANIEVVDRFHPSTAALRELWTRTDEWYNFRTNPRGQVHILAMLDETSYTGGDMKFDHPISWCQNFDGGRSWYTAMGHTRATYTEPLYLMHLLGGIRTAAGAEEADCEPTP